MADETARTLNNDHAHKIIEAAAVYNEPVFVIRAQDKVAIKALGAYIMLAEAEGVSPLFIIDLCRRIEEFANYKLTNSIKMKRPDL